MAKEALDRVSARLFTGQVSNGVRLATELVNACRIEQWERAIDRGEQLRGLLAVLLEDTNLKPDESNFMGAAIDDLSLALRLFEERAKGKKKSLLPIETRVKLDRLIVFLSRLDGRLKHAALEIRHA